MTTILIVDDDTHVLQNVREILELENYDVLLVSDGLAGVIAASQHHVDLVICDVVMPVFDGFMVFQQLRSMPETQHIPILFITGFKYNPILKRIVKEGESHCLFKPFRAHELLAAVSEALSSKAGA